MVTSGSFLSGRIDKEASDDRPKPYVTLRHLGMRKRTDPFSRSDRPRGFDRSTKLLVQLTEIVGHSETSGDESSVLLNECAMVFLNVSQKVATCEGLLAY